MADEDIIARFRADVEGYKKDINDAVDATGKFDKKVDATTKTTQEFSKNTKGAASSIGTLSRGLGGVAGLLGITGRLFGVNTDKIQELIFTSQQFARTAREFQNAQKLSTAATQASTVATAAASGGIALLITGIVAAAGALYAWISAKKTDTEITEKQIELNKELNKSNEESIKISNDAKIAALENQAALIKASGTETIAATEAVAVAEYKILLEKLKQTQDAIDDANREKLKAQQVFDENVRRLLVSPEKFTEEQKAEARLVFQNKDNELQQLLILQEAYKNQVAILDKGLVKDVKKIKDTAAEERKQKLQKDYDDEIKLLDEAIKKAIVLYGKDSAAFIKAQDDKNKARNDFFKKQEDLILGNAEIEASLTESKIDDENARFQTELNNLERQFDSETKKTEAFKRRKELLEKQHQKNLTDIQSADLEKRRQNRIDEEKQMLDTLFKAQEDAYNRNKELQDNAIEDQQRNIDTQRNLAARGLDNTLAFEERRLIEQKRAQEKEAQVQKRVKLLETFLNSLASFSKEDPKTALSKALLQVALATAASAVFAEEGGVIGEIGARSNLRRRHKGGGDILLHAQKGEGIIPVDSMNAIGRRNFELLKNAGRFPIRDNIFAMPKQNNLIGVAVMDNSDVIKELKHLQNVVKNKKENSYTMDEFGNYINTQIENGFKTITMGKLPKIRFNGRS